MEANSYDKKTAASARVLWETRRRVGLYVASKGGTAQEGYLPLLRREVVK